jgi:glucose/arabinose dehydrogenase
MVPINWLKMPLAALGMSALMTVCAPSLIAAEFDTLLDQIKLPPGFKIGIYAKLPNPRSMAIGKPPDTVFVGSRHDAIYILRDTNQDGSADGAMLRAGGLNIPNGVALLDAMLYIALNDKVVRWPLPTQFDTTPPQPLRDVSTGLPAEFMHGWRYAKFGPDRKLYVAIGSPCNICQVTGLQGTIIRMNPDGSGREIFARGVRNSVGFDWHPKTGVLFFTDNGADGMGDNVPPDELNRADQPGMHFGFPWIGGKSVKLTGFETVQAPQDVVAPVIEFAAHTASLGIHFYDGDMFPAEYKHDAFVAQHGSWNRTEPIGYRIMRIRFDAAGNAVGKEVFADGWLKAGKAVGRPVDIAELADGSLLVSDDFAHVIYRIWYDG